MSDIWPYTLLEELGSSSLGTVYHATDVRLEREVALRIIPASVQKALKKRVLADLERAAQLDHPAIATLGAAEPQDDGRLLISGQYYEGQSLAERLCGGPMPWREALGLLLEVARGLSYAHALGVVHGDIKPSNLLLTQEGWKILGFGLAALKRTDTEGAAVSGSLLYMAPEYLRTQEASFQTDIWSLGVVLYEALSGKHPFHADNSPAASLLAILSQEPVPIRDWVADVPPFVDDLIATALVKETAHRYADLGTWIADTEALLDGGAKPAFAPSGVPVMPAPGPHNLVTPENEIIGRHDELALIELYLRDPECQVITLLGPGGTGKTRLALEAAHEQLGRFWDGVYFIALDKLADSALIPTSIAEALSLSLEGARDALSQIIGAIEHKDVCLVLDNYEHVMDGAELVVRLIRSCPQLKILVTSRERLDISGEWILPVQGLAYPQQACGVLSEALSFGAVKLFMQRAKRANPSFSLDETTLPDVLALCRLIRGLPLGVELAAAWTDQLTVADILAEVTRNYDFLSRHEQHLPERHRSIRAVFDYSWRLLSPQEKTTLTRLAVFRGGIGEKAFTAVTAAPSAVLTDLVDKSLLQVIALKRFQHHPVLLPYIEEKAAGPDHLMCQQKHAEFFLALLQVQGEALRGPDQKEAMQRLTLELDNVRSAWRWATAQRAESLIEVSAEPLRVFCDQKGLFEEGLQLFSNAAAELAGSGTHERTLSILRVKQAHFEIALAHHDRAQRNLEISIPLLKRYDTKKDLLMALSALAKLLLHQGDNEEARQHLHESLFLAKQVSDTRMTVSILDNLGYLEHSSGNPERAQTFFEEGLSLSRKDNNLLQIVYTLNNLANLFLSLGKTRQAEPLLQEGLALAQEQGTTRIIPIFQANLGLIKIEQLDFEGARHLFEEALKLVRERGERWTEAAISVQLGKIATAQSRLERAGEQLLGALHTAWEIGDLSLSLHVLTYLAHWQLCLGQKAEARTLLCIVDSHSASNQEDRLEVQKMLQAWNDTCENVPTLETVVAELLAETVVR